MWDCAADNLATGTWCGEQETKSMCNESKNCTDSGSPQWSPEAPSFFTNLCASRTRVTAARIMPPTPAISRETNGSRATKWSWRYNG
eukprot:CAMPEP_0174991068 /NCGR_PEP_ID=MMETSP0004_2-20121128/21671_1 /TAXON_ID=420556 /ORGANISM="Ochromonas sp., Strain CCMP1393" /LENGTH=86 /DNA_ID=CAMNT_0016244745 /DNA_START=111 /DNA_END=368 /DNA_ORIENTATION=-